MRRRLGILGGTFNPIHNGHIAIASIALEEGGLDRLLLLPDGVPPHKGDLESPLDRLGMTILAGACDPRMEASDLEVFREGTTYTIDTLRLLGDMYPEDQLIYVIGGDTLYNVPTWRQVEHLHENCSMFAVPRWGDQRDELLTQAQLLHQRYELDVTVAQRSGPEVSSTVIRQSLAKQESVEDFLPAPVLEYIGCHGLYGCSYNQTAQRLRRTLSPYRFRHTLSVAQTAVLLANRFGVNPYQAHTAGMLHDCAKGIDAPQLLRLIKTGGVSADELELSMPALLHAPAGAVLAKMEYHVSNPAILAAIRWHTTGRRNMTPLEKVVYLADMIEPGREPFEGLEEIRQLAKTDLDAAVHMAAVCSAAYVSKRGKRLHPRTYELAKEQETEKE